MTLYLVQASGVDDDALAHARFVPDGFCWSALVFAQIWLLYHRLWLALLAWILLEVAFVLLVLPHVTSATATAVDALAHLFIGFEGNRLRQAKGAKRAAVSEFVEARDRDEAEAVFYRRIRPPGEGA